MSTDAKLTDRDRNQLERVGITSQEIARQLQILRRSPEMIVLERSCRVGDGILRFDEGQQGHYIELWEELRAQRRLAKFVPASGAASRMFRELTQLQQVPATAASASNSDLRESMERFWDSLEHLPFFPRLRSLLERRGDRIEDLIHRRDHAEILAALLDHEGLGYRHLPKGLIPFHLYAEEDRTATIEHLWEGVDYLARGGGRACLHLTVPEEYREPFERHIGESLPTVQREVGVEFEVDLSTQRPNTDTVAIDLEGRLFRQEDGSLLLRPAGHGALLGNLESLDADVVYVKNIDNVAYRRLHSTSVHWKRVLGGFFWELQTTIFDLLDKLRNGVEPKASLGRARSLVADKLCLDAPAEPLDADLDRQIACWIDWLDRPLRVCGVVENRGEPGGGPFWVRRKDGSRSGQIVEFAQLDPKDSEQTEIWRSSTHFNPVDLVCGLRDAANASYRLSEYVDPSTTIVARKSHHGRALKAMERPGLWNGAMAGWNTAFVEVPLTTFTPVKTVYDLLRPEHRPRDRSAQKGRPR